MNSPKWAYNMACVVTLMNIAVLVWIILAHPPGICGIEVTAIP